LYDVEFTEHSRRENVHTRIVLEQEFSDVAAAHVRRPAQSCFKISVTPVNGPVNQIWFFGQHRFHRRKISMSRNDEALYTRPIKLRMVLRKIRHIVSGFRSC